MVDKKKTNQLLIAVVAIIAIVIVIAGVYVVLNNSGGDGSGNSATVQPGTSASDYKEPYTIKMYNNPSSVSLEMVAEKLGFFKEENLTIQYVGVLNSDATTAAVINGDIDFAAYHIPRYILAMNQGAKIKAVAPSTLTTPEYPHTVGYVLNNSSIKTAKDFVGKKVGVYARAGCCVYMLLEYMYENGVDDPEKKIEFVQVPFESMQQALESGQIDAAMIMGVYELKARDSPSLRKVFDDNEIKFDMSLCAYITREDMIKNHPDVVKRYIRAITKAAYWINDHPDEAKEIGAEVLKVDKKYAYAYHYQDDGLLYPEKISVWMDVLQRYGAVKSWSIDVNDTYVKGFEYTREEYDREYGGK